MPGISSKEGNFSCVGLISTYLVRIIIYRSHDKKSVITNNKLNSKYAQHRVPILSLTPTLL